jgi:hypothetical protein
MSSRALPGLGLMGGRAAGESGWATEMNTNLLTLSATGQLAVKSRVTALPGSPTNGDIYIVPSSDGTNPNKVAVRDNGAWVYLTPSTGWRAYVIDEGMVCLFNGTAWVFNPATVAVGTFSETAPTASQILLDWLFVEATTFADEFAGSRASVGTNPTATFNIDVRKNGSSVGTISISTGGAATFTTTGTTVSFAAGDLLTLVAPSPADATIARLRITLKGTR